MAVRQADRDGRTFPGVDSPHEGRTARHLGSVAWLVGLLLTGCAPAWQSIPLPADTLLRPRQHLQVWQQGHARVLHSVRVTPESIGGVPYHLPPLCDSCRVALPRAQVDSTRVGNPEAVGVANVLFPLAALAAWLYLGLRGLGGS